MARGKRKRIASCIYEDQYGRAAVIRTRGHREEIRFAPDTPIATIRREINKRRDAIEDTTPEGAARGTLDKVVADYLATLPEGAYKTERAQLLDAWTTALGTRAVAGLRRSELVDVIDAWRAAKLSASRQNKRISALRVVWRRIAPDHAVSHPIEHLERTPEPKAQIDRALPMDLLARVIENVSEDGFAGAGKRRDVPSLCRARLRCLLWTGQPASTLSRILPEHVRWEAQPPEVYIQPRRKGAGVDAAWVPLLPQAVRAFHDLFLIGAHGGKWHNGNLRRAWNAGLKRTRQQLIKEGHEQEAARLDGMRVYDMRHSYLTALAIASGDIYAVAEAARHSDLKTTRRYMRGASSVRLKAGLNALSEALPTSRSGS